MAYVPKILAFAGSTRTGSFNKKLVKIAADYARETGVEITLIDLRDYPMPLYDGDLEKNEGIPENAKKLRELMLENDGLLIASPEYNSSFSGVLKNTIDWISRPEEGKPPLHCFTGKIAALMAASPGYRGGLRGLAHLTDVLGDIGVLILPNQVKIRHADNAFDENGKLKKENDIKAVEVTVSKLINTLRKLKAE